MSPLSMASGPLAIFDVLPGWVWAAIVAGLVVVGAGAIAVQTVRLSSSQTEVATLGTQIQKDRAERLQLVADHNLKVAAMQATHAKVQQEIISGYTDQYLKLQGERALDRARADRVQQLADAAAARDREAARSDPAACGRVADNNAALYGLVAEGFRLVVEGGDLARAAANDIGTLKALIQNDRASICGGATTTP